MRPTTNLVSNIYQVTTSPKENMDNNKVYIGISVGVWKQRFYTHKHLF